MNTTTYNILSAVALLSLILMICVADDSIVWCGIFGVVCGSLVMLLQSVEKRKRIPHWSTRVVRYNTKLC